MSTEVEKLLRLSREAEREAEQERQRMQAELQKTKDDMAAARSDVSQCPQPAES